MGMFFNPGNGSFESDIHNEIYIDKSGLLKELNRLIGSSKNCISLSHARRFGKSQAAGMIDAYYSIGSDSRELFSKFEIARDPDFEKYLNKYNVIHIDVSVAADLDSDNLVETIIKRLFEELKKEITAEINYDQNVSYVLNDIYQATGAKFVIIIDEWDCVIRNKYNSQDLVHRYLNFLHAIFKSEESKSYLALGYITGILPIKKIENESALNNFREYTMLESDQFTRYFGFTEEEVKELCQRYNMDYASVKQWYNGYLISGMHMYNPNSVYEAMVRGRLESYWKNTSSFKSINRLISLNMEGLKDDILTMLSGGCADVDVSTFQNDISEIETKDDVLTALIHLGYLGYDAENKNAFVPNYEVSEAFKSALKTGEWSEIAKSIAHCDEILKATINGNADRVAELVELAHDTYTSILKYNDENSLSCVLTMAYFTAPAYYNVVREMPSGKGFADFVFIPRANAGARPAMVIELKYDQSADSAIRQIKDGRYAGALTGYSDRVLLVGISYDSRGEGRKKHTCVIEELEVNVE